MFDSKKPDKTYQRARRLLRLVAGATSLCMTWLTVGPSGAAMLAPRHQPQSVGHTRALSAIEMKNIVGAGPGGPSTNPTHQASLDPASGSTYPWEGDAGGVNTGNGNKTTSLPIVGWKVRGGRLGVSLSLTHNSQSTHNSELGHKWTHSYDIYSEIDASTGDFTVHWGDDLSYTFVKDINGDFDAPAGIHDTLTQSGTGTSATYSLKSKDQITYDFSYNTGAAGWYCDSITDRNGNAITIAHNTAGYVTSVTDPTNRAITFTYTGGKLTSVNDPLSRTWSFTYDGNDDLVDVDFPTVSSTTYGMEYGYNTAHSITSMTDLRGKVWTFAYYNGSSLTSETDPLSHSTTYSYNGTYTKITDANGHFTKDYYNSNGELSSSVDASGKTESYSYDSNHNKVQVTDKRGHNWTFTFDSRGNVLTKTDPLSRTVTWTYNSKNDRHFVTTALNRVIACTYDTSGNLSSYTDPISNVNTMTYNTNGMLATKTDSNSHTTSYGYDTDGNLTSVTTPGSKVTTFAYNGLGVKTSRTDALSRVTTYTLDAWNRTTAVSYSASGSSPQSITYDANNNQTVFTDGTGTTTRTFDDANRQISETTARGTVSYTYDATGQAGQFSHLIDPSGRTISYTYTATGRFASISETASGSSTTATTSYTYDDAGEEIGVINSNGTQVAKTYDNAGQLTGVVNTDASNNMLSSFDYTYTDDGQRSSLTEYDGSVVSYTYNGMGRLTGESRTGTVAYTASYTLDGEGNRTSQTVGTKTTAFTYDTDDALTQATSTTGGLNNTYSYNGNGEQTGRTLGGVSYSLYYDGDGQLVQITGGAGGTTNTLFSYDAVGRRISRTASGTTTSFVYNGTRILLDMQGSSVQARYTYGNTLIGKNGDVNLYDGQGTSRQTSDASTGTVTSDRVFEGFGQTVASTGVGQNYGYAATSGYRDDGDAGLMHVGARYYDAQVGRFLTRDTFLSQKPYTYCEGDAINAVDPSGHFLIVLAIIAIILCIAICEGVGQSNDFTKEDWHDVWKQTEKIGRAEALVGAVIVGGNKTGINPKFIPGEGSVLADRNPWVAAGGAGLALGGGISILISWIGQALTE